MFKKIAKYAGIVPVLGLVFGVANMANAQQASTLDSTAIGTLIGDFIGEIVDLVVANLPAVLAFAAGILVWFILKKWVFGGTRRI